MHVTGIGKSRPVAAGESAMWTGSPKRMGVETFFSGERAEARGYSAQQRDRLYPARFAGSSVNLSYGRSTGIDVLYGWSQGIWIGDAEGE